MKRVIARRGEEVKEFASIDAAAEFFGYRKKVYRGLKKGRIGEWALSTS
jgi:hypothetical protein